MRRDLKGGGDDGGLAHRELGPRWREGRRQEEESGGQQGVLSKAQASTKVIKRTDFQKFLTPYFITGV